MVVGGERLLRLYGETYVAGWPALGVLVFGMVGNALSGSVGFMLSMTGREKVVASVFAVGCGLNLALDVLLIPVYGATGAAVGTAVTLLTWNGVLLVAVRRELGIDSTVLSALRQRWQL